MRPVFKEFKVDGISALSIFEYNEVIKEKLFLFKGCKDFELRHIFVEPFEKELKAMFHNYIFIPMPSFHLADKERGFNHVEEMFRCFGNKIHPILSKTMNVKQANLRSEERKQIKKIIEIKEDVDIGKYKGKNICLIDDVCTTRSTLKSALQIVKQFKPKKIKILVMSSTVLDSQQKE